MILCLLDLIRSPSSCFMFFLLDASNLSFWNSFFDWILLFLIVFCNLIQIKTNTCFLWLWSLFQLHYFLCLWIDRYISCARFFEWFAIIYVLSFLDFSLILKLLVLNFSSSTFLFRTSQWCNKIFRQNKSE
jgi:hypothetical protein